MRANGQKIEPAAIGATQPTRGHLTIWRYLDHQRRRHIRVASLSLEPSPSTKHLIPRLDDVKINRWNDKGLVLVGIEQIDRSRRDLIQFPQAWWVRFVEP